MNYFVRSRVLKISFNYLCILYALVLAFDFYYKYRLDAFPADGIELIFFTGYTVFFFVLLLTTFVVNLLYKDITQDFKVLQSQIAQLEQRLEETTQK